MKKCTIYLDFVNSDTFDENDSKAMKDIIAHSLHCTDCSYDRRVREDMLSTLAEFPEPNYPSNLHEFSMNQAFDKRADLDDKPDWVARFFMNLLKPMEVAIPLASVAILCFMIQLNSSSSANLAQSDNNEPNTAIKKFKIAEASENYNENGLQKVSSEEVKEFLAKLDEFQRLHPESKTIPNSYRHDVRLVGSR